jgi:cysteine synthase
VLTHDKAIIDSTSGNTGIAYAMVAAAKGYRVKLVMPANVSAERKALISAYGAEVVYSDAGEGSDGAIRLVRELVAADPDSYFYPDQYSNPANARAHYDGTAVEILEQTGGRVTHFIAGLGTTGTFVGTSRRLKEHDPSIRTIAVQPEDSFHGLEGLKHIPTAIVPKIWDPSLADEIWGCPTPPAARGCWSATRVARRYGRRGGSRRRSTKESWSPSSRTPATATCPPAFTGASEDQRLRPGGGARPCGRGLSQRDLRDARGRQGLA